MDRLKLPTLLAVTENPTIRFWIKKHLDEDFFIVNASDKHTALAAAQTTSFDFIVVDSEFENCDPIELCSELKQILLTLTPILLITGRLKKSYLDKAKAAGVTDFLNNQLDLEEFQTKIAAIKKGYSLREKTQGASSALAHLKKDYSVTYLKNRVHLQTQALKTLKEAQNENVPISALIVHIDLFNELLNRFGNAISEEILIPFTNLIKRFLSSTDRLIPSAEGRFLILLKNRTPENARGVAEEMRKLVSKTPFQTKSGALQLTTSIAVSSLEGTESDLNLMLDSSFKALQKAQDLIISIDTEKS